MLGPMIFLPIIISMVLCLLQSPTEASTLHASQLPELWSSTSFSFMANYWSHCRDLDLKTRPDILLPDIPEYDENELALESGAAELQGAVILQQYIDSHPMTIGAPSLRNASEPPVSGIVTPGNFGFTNPIPAWELELQDLQPVHPGTRPLQLSHPAMDAQDPSRDQGSYSYYQPPTAAQYYHYPDPSTTQQQTYAPIYAAPASYTPPLLSPQPPYSPSDYSHGQLTLTQAQYEAAQAQAEASYAATTSQPPSQYAISDAPSSSSIEDPDVKRQRNTAASARFRAKKKQREQELQASERAKREALQRLEGKVKDLEDENRFLKDLILTPKEKRKEKERMEREGEDEDEGNATEGPGDRKRKGKDGVGTRN